MTLSLRANKRIAEIKKNNGINPKMNVKKNGVVNNPASNNIIPAKILFFILSRPINPRIIGIKE